MIISEQDFNEWRHHHVTKGFFKALFNGREWLKENLVMGATDNPENIKGRCEIIRNILEMKYEDLILEMKEKE